MVVFRENSFFVGNWWRSNLIDVFGECKDFFYNIKWKVLLLFYCREDVIMG